MPLAWKQRKKKKKLLNITYETFLFFQKAYLWSSINMGEKVRHVITWQDFPWVQFPLSCYGKHWKDEPIFSASITQKVEFNFEPKQNE